MDEGPFSPSSHCLRASYPPRGVPHAALLVPGPYQLTSLSLSLLLYL